jgi:hypothetical protein
MTASVSENTASTQSVAVNDQISISTLIANSCGQFTYSILSVQAAGVVALSSSELTISSAGLVSVSTSNYMTIGTHTVTVTGTLVSYP